MVSNFIQTNEMKLERPYEFVLTGLGIALMLFLLPAIISAFYSTPAFWMLLIAALSVGVIYLGVEMFMNVKKLNPATSIVPGTRK